MPSRIELIALATVALTSTAFAGDLNNAASYNSGYGMTAGQENQAANPNLRDSNGNLTVVNGQFTSSNFSRQSGVQSASTLGSYASQTSSSYGSATAIGNSLNVVTVGSHNTVIVNSTQTNNGNQTATANTNGSSGQ